MPKTDRGGVQCGAYVIEEDDDADLTVIGVGAELGLAVDVAERLREKESSQYSRRRVRVVSFPSHRLFEKQPRDYRQATLRRHTGVPAVVIEPYAALGWERYADAAVCMSTDRFGQSLPGTKAYEYFGFEVETVAQKIEGYLQQRHAGQVSTGEFVELK
jgi:dihydroxyacetone synthase